MKITPRMSLIRLALLACAPLKLAADGINAPPPAPRDFYAITEPAATPAPAPSAAADDHYSPLGGSPAPRHRRIPS